MPKPIKSFEARKELKKDVKTKMAMFDSLPDKCTTCEKPFDKKSKEMAQTWSVVFKQKEQSCSLFCPECLATAKTLFAEQIAKKED